MTVPQWSTACTDWADRLRHGRSIIPPPIYADQAEAALAIFKALRVVDQPGRPTFGECCDQWVFDFVAAIFGAYDAETGNQLIREFYLLISKKNTKSTIAAGIMLTALLLCWREEEEHLILSPTKEIADNSFKPAAAMVRADDELKDLLHVQDHYRTITHRTSRNSLKVVAADTDAVSGKKSGRVLIDEHWLFGKKADAAGMFIEALGGQVSRDEGWVIYLTTQSDEQPAGVFLDKLNYFRDVRDGKRHDPRSLGVLYEFPPEMVESKAYLDPANFHITNPNIGRSVSREWLVDQLSKLQGKTDGTYQQFLAKHLNIEIGLNLRSDRWAGADFWEKQADKSITLDALFKRCSVLVVGIDGGGNDDLYGFTVMGRDSETNDLLSWSHAWALPIVLERRKSIAPQLLDFEKQGDLTFVKKIEEACDAVVAIIKRADDAGLLGSLNEGKKRAIGVDPAGIKQTLDALNAAGYPDVQIVAVSQNWRLTSDIKSTELYLSSEALWHADQPLMNWCVGNAKAEPKGNAVLITKQTSGSAKVDPLMSLFNCIDVMSHSPQASNAGAFFAFLADRAQPETAE